MSLNSLSSKADVVYQVLQMYVPAAVECWQD